MRVLFVVTGGLDIADIRYRCGHFVEALRGAGIDAEICSVQQARVRVAHDVIVLHRVGLDTVGARFVQAARACKAALVYSADDLIFEPEFAYQGGILHPHDPAKYHWLRGVVAANAAMAREADAMLVSTEFLAGRARLLTNKPVHVVRNFLSGEILSLSADAVKHKFPCRNRVTLGYLSGSATHDADLADIADPLRRILRRHENVNLLLVGTVSLPPGLDRFASRIQRHPFVNWRDLPGLLAGIDINLAPLDPSRPFNHAKSEVKFIEAAAVQVPTIAGKTAGFAEAVRHGEEGFLAESRSDWDQWLDLLISRPAEREEMAAKACAAVYERATAAHNAESLAALFRSLAVPSPDTAGDKRRVAVVTRPFGVIAVAAARDTERWIWQKFARLARHARLLAAE